MPDAERRFRRYFQNQDQSTTGPTVPPEDDDILGGSLAGLDLIFSTTTGFRNEWRRTKTALLAVHALEQEFGKIRTGETKHSAMFHVVAYPAYCLQATEYLADAHAFLRSHHLVDEPFEEGMGRLAPQWLRTPHLLTPQNVPPTLVHLAQRKEPVPTFYILRGLARVLKKQNRGVSDDEFLFLAKIFMENLDTPVQSATDGIFISSLPYLARETIAKAQMEKSLPVHFTDTTRGIIDMLDQYFTTSMLAIVDEDNPLADTVHTYFERLLDILGENDDVKKEIALFNPHLYGLFTKERAGKFVGAAWLVRQIGRIAEEDQDPLAQRFNRDALHIYNVFLGNMLTPETFIPAITLNQKDPPTSPTRIASLLDNIRTQSREKNHWVIITNDTSSACSIAGAYELGLFNIQDQREGLLLVEGFLTQHAPRFLEALASKTPTPDAALEPFRYLLDMTQNEVLVDSPREIALSPKEEQFFLHLTQSLLEEYKKQHTKKSTPQQTVPQAPPSAFLSFQASKSKGPEQTMGSGRKRKHRSVSTSQRLTEEVHTLVDEARERRLRPKFQYDEELFAHVQQKYGYTADQMNFFRQKLANFNETQHGIFKLLSYVVGPNGGDAYSLRAGRRYRILAEKRNGEVVVYDVLPRSLLPS